MKSLTIIDEWLGCEDVVPVVVVLLGCLVHMRSACYLVNCCSSVHSQQGSTLVWNTRDSGGESVWAWEWMGRNGGWEHVDGVLNLRIRQGFFRFELSNWGIVWNNVMSELASQSMPDDVLRWGDSGGGKAKSGLMGIGVWSLAGWKIERWRDPTCRLIMV